MVTTALDRLGGAQVLDDLIDQIQQAGQILSEDDVVYHDQDLELLVPAISRVFLKYAEQGHMFIGRKQAMIQIFDTITRFVQDPDLLPNVELHPDGMIR